MQSIETLDFFEINPIREFVGAGFHKYRHHWGWERNLSNASLYMIADGSLRFSFADNRSFIAEKNDVVFLKKSDVATIYNESLCHSSLYYIAFNYDEEYNLCLNTIYKNTAYLNTFRDLLEAHLSKAPLSRLKISFLMQKLLYNLATDNLHSREDYKNISQIRAAAEYINVNYYKNITLDSLCKLTGYSEAHLRRLFVKNFGMSPQNYILEKRMEMAKEMLLDIPEKTVEEIADMLGISSTSYFCKQFKSKVGMSPSEFKKKHTKK